ncbi:DNA polymerase III subunit gamma/tau [Sphingosinicella sp. LY1275]|uniref:DNA polymerase III subunit gamma/tau n=1 Tax=Sphingosinicella sp. LY1275 TaxID=3095379 RepID=UPI002ADEDD58|nr:DNA polymerase III subunit gamma/tau [Sphingosinicella sp. LY1275]MEA1013326.1 DNA polymerase III subunit gamma/tau [Sphingosinicella sp. LY1275]
MPSDSPDSFGLGLDEPPQPAKPVLSAASGAEGAQPYRVLARKYRPQSFEELIGQDAMVRTLGNAIKRDRLAHAFILTGVRGVGKTSTARLVAKALNCIGPDGQGGPTISPCGVCEPCVAIAEGRHIDVVEMDAASNTGVDDVREIIEAVRYAAVSARYKVYIIDEVHMLSKNAFNALLKTLEEPPAHVKFLFATTEVNKVPVTVLSRCQRFDLRRISAEQLAAHFADVSAREGAEVEPEALALIARAAEGSARDGLSILDQAIAHGHGAVTADQVRAMLGLSDRGAIRKLLGLLLAGDARAALAAIKDQHDLGVDPAALLRGLLESVHGITRAKVGGATDPAQSHEERAAYEEWAGKLSYAAVHRLWQLLLKGLGEVQTAAMPLEAAEMALLRVIHASEMPDPGALMEQLASGGAVSVPQRTAPAASAAQAEMAHQPAVPEAPAPAFQAPPTFAGLVDYLANNGKPHLAQMLHDFVGVVRYAPPELVIRPTKPMAGDFMRDLAASLKVLSGTIWTIEASEGEAEPSLLEQEKKAAGEVRQAVLDSPMVKAAFDAFPDAELTHFTINEQRSA